MDGLKDLQNKKVKLFLKETNVTYSGEVIEITDHKLLLKDKYGLLVLVSTDSINNLVELQ